MGRAVQPWLRLLVVLGGGAVGVAATAPAPSRPVDAPGGPGYRAFPLAVPATGRGGFTRLEADATGVRFTNRVSDADLARNLILEIGSGVALGDMDGDGLTDLYFCSMAGANRLYRNLGGWRFEDRTGAAGADLACAGQFSTGALFADLDGDADLDLLVNGIGSGTRLFLNEGRGRFREAADSGLRRDRGSTSMTVADVDGDGRLDLYVANYHTRTVKDSPGALQIEAGFQGGRFVINPPGQFRPIFLRSGGVSLLELGEEDCLYRNLGGGRFAPVDWTDGTFVDAAGKVLTEAPREWGLAAMFRDLNDDGAPDLCVCNDFFESLDQFWLNTGSGRFRPLSPSSLRHTSMSSMAMDFADLDRDGRDDFLVLDMLSRGHESRHRQRASLVHLQASVPVRAPAARPEYPRNMLFWNRGDGTYAEIAQFSGVEASEWSWSVVFLDVDLDGFEDVLVANGTLRDANDADLAQAGAGRMDGRETLRHRNLRFPPSETSNLIFRNQGDLTFQECGEAWGFDTVGVSHGMALADLDHDGDLDVVVNHMRQAAGLYRNDSPAPRVAVRAVGKDSNIQGIGARIVLHGGAVERQGQQVLGGGRYLSGDDPLRVFAAGPKRSGLRLEVIWRDGTSTVVEDVRPDHLYEVHQTAAAVRPGTPVGGEERPLFEDVRSRLRQPHQEAEDDETARQPTLTRRFARLGPGVAWRDLDGDGGEDLVLGGARNGYGIVYLNDGSGVFKATRRRAPLARDQTTVLTLLDPEGQPELLAGSASYEDTDPAVGGVVKFDLTTGGEFPVVGPNPGSVGPLALGSIRNQQVLFVGGRVRPGRYPEPAPSRLYLRAGGAWQLDAAGSAALAAVRMASGAVWADLDGAGDPELVVASDWGPIRVFRFDEGAVVELTRNLGLEAHAGWWNGVAAGDFDEDGRLDLLATNWGRNTRYQRHRHRPIRLYYGDWQGQGRPEVLEAYHDPVRNGYVPFLTLDALRVACPGLAAKFPTFADYARAGVAEVTGVREQDLTFLEANWLETTLFLHRGDRLEAVPLPREAQWAPAFGVSIADVDGDGHEDAFLAQNLFDVDPDTSRHDAGQGLLLRGDGRGRLLPVPGRTSGIQLEGEQRGSAFADFDRDGRVDLAVGQNDGPVGLFRNRGARPGLRVRLAGPPWNRDGAGATLRLKFSDRLGPARCVQMGSGYWSQEGVVHVLGGPETPTGLWVRWPGGRVTETDVRPGEREVVVAWRP